MLVDKNLKMKVYDKVYDQHLELTRDELIHKMAVENREVNLKLFEEKTDNDDYLTWDEEHWTGLDARRFIRCYSCNGRILRDSSGHNDYDLKNDFYPHLAKDIFLA